MSFSACCRTLAVSILKPRLGKDRAVSWNQQGSYLHLGSKLTVISCIPQHVRKPCKLSRQTCIPISEPRSEISDKNDFNDFSSPWCTCFEGSQLPRSVHLPFSSVPPFRSFHGLGSFGVKFGRFEVRNGGLVCNKKCRKHGRKLFTSLFSWKDVT